jgi:hypothetical protein
MTDYYKVTVPTTYIVEAVSPEEAQEALRFASNREITYTVRMKEMDLESRASYLRCNAWGDPVDA